MRYPFVHAFLGFVCACSASWPAAAAAVIVVQRSALAGFRHHDAPAVWRDVRQGDRLDLVREADNPYDPNAVRVEWRGRKLGYLPRSENAAVARQLDRGTMLQANVARLTENRNHSVRLEVEVVASLGVVRQERDP